MYQNRQLEGSKTASVCCSMNPYDNAVIRALLGAPYEVPAATPEQIAWLVDHFHQFTLDTDFRLCYPSPSSRYSDDWKTTLSEVQITTDQFLSLCTAYLLDGTDLPISSFKKLSYSPYCQQIAPLVVALTVAKVAKHNARSTQLERPVDVLIYADIGYHADFLDLSHMPLECFTATMYCNLRLCLPSLTRLDISPPLTDEPYTTSLLKETVPTLILDNVPTSLVSIKAPFVSAETLGKFSRLPNLLKLACFSDGDFCPTAPINELLLSTNGVVDLSNTKPQYVKVRCHSLKIDQANEDDLFCELIDCSAFKSNVAPVDLIIRDRMPTLDLPSVICEVRVVDVNDCISLPPCQSVIIKKCNATRVNVICEYVTVFKSRIKCLVTSPDTKIEIK